MAKTPRTVEQGRANLEASIVLIPERYRQGVQGADWHTPAASDAAESRYAQATQRAISLRSRQAGIRRTSNEQWRSAALAGADKIGEGIRMHLDKWATNFGRIYTGSVLPALRQLPPPGADAMANIDSRLKPIVRAFQMGAGKIGPGGPPAAR